MNIQRAIRLFRRAYVGQTIRGQRVNDVGILAETMGDDVRWFATVHFEENPAPLDSSPNDRFWLYINSEIPSCADVFCPTWRELVRLVRRYRPEAPWRLDDEMRDGSSLEPMMKGERA